MNFKKVRIIGLALSALAIGQAAQAMELDKEALNKKLLNAATGKSTKDILQLLDQGADVNFADRAGVSPLHKACSNNCLEVVRLLIERGADVNLVTSMGWTPLHVAGVLGNSKIVKLLVERGAYINLQNMDCKTVLDIANERGYSDIVLIIMHEQQGRIKEKQALTEKRLLEYLQRKNAENLNFILLLSRK